MTMTAVSTDPPAASDTVSGSGAGLDVVRSFFGRRVVAANVLSELSGNSDASSHYAHPSDVVRFVTDELTSRVVLRHDYRKNDFTVFLYR